MDFKLSVWKQKNQEDPGKFVEYEVENISPDTTFLEMLDIKNEQLILENNEPIEFDSDCREGICGTCGFVINGIAHGPKKLTTVCQLYMREFSNNETITIEPFRSKSFEIIKDLVVDRSAFDRIISAGGFISVNTGNAPDANSILIPKKDADDAMDYATCIGCGACVASCPNASASLFTSAKIKHLGLLPQGGPERKRRVLNMIKQMDNEGFGNCSNHAECEAVCPKGISINSISFMRKEFIKSVV